MVSSPKTGYNSPIAIHPGETVKETLDLIGMSQKDLSDRSELSEKTISLIISGDHPISPESALKFERVLGLSQRMLLQMYADYEADLFRLQEKARLENEIKLLSEYDCYGELTKFGFVEKYQDKSRRAEELLKFFGVNSLSSVPPIMNTDDISFRRNTKRKVNSGSLDAWLRMGYLQALKRNTADFDKSVLAMNIEKMRTLTKLPARDFSKKLIALCAEAGVALVYTPHLKNTFVSGSARWIAPSKALVQVSLFYKSADIFWFSLFHELGHILKHSKKTTFVEFENSANSIDKIENEADLFAQQLLVPSDREEQYQLLKKSLSRFTFTKQIRDFANTLDLDPGIVAGRIARETGAWKYVSQLRKHIQFTDEKR